MHNTYFKCTNFLISEEFDVTRFVYTIIFEFNEAIISLKLCRLHVNFKLEAKR